MPFITVHQFGSVSTFWLFVTAFVMAKTSNSSSQTQLDTIQNGSVYLEIRAEWHPAPLDVSCYDSLGQPYEENIPNPFDCTMFYKCAVVVAPDIPAPHPEPCSNGQGLCWDMIQCGCIYCHESPVCFDVENPEHNTDEFRLQCARPINSATY